MSFWAFLKGILPEQFIKVEVNNENHIDNRKIELNSDSIIMGDQTITDPKIIDKVFDKLAEYKTKESLPCHVVHKDLEESFSEYETISDDYKDKLKTLKTILLPDDIECILMARRVKLAYDKGEIEFAKKVQKQLNDNFPNKGNKVYNLMGGGYFDEMIFPFIDIFKQEEDYVNKFREFYADIVRFFPLAFFVGNGTSEDKIKENLISRLNKQNFPFIRIHSIGQLNIEKVETVISEMDIESKYITKDKRFTSPVGLKAQIFEIKMKKSDS